MTLEAGTATPTPVRERIRVRGEVQGVGFRPFVYRLAIDLGLAGWVRNDGQGVEIEVEGAPAAVRDLERRLRDEAPPLARISAVEHEPILPSGGPDGFQILASGGGLVLTGVTPDAATCAACLRELFDPADRRHRYPFTNCTHCGPRYTITGALPYDRPHTSMAPFRMCGPCQREYDDPGDRRFHAQPNACPACGPRLALRGPDGAPLPADDVLAETLRRLGAGEIVALKGLGGFHLVCDARQGHAVRRLRERKNREDKPLAVMVASVASLTELVTCDHEARGALESVQRPIVLLPKRPGCDATLPGVAPGIAWLGVMLPYTPLHALLFHEAAGRPEGDAWLSVAQPLVLVMTSANPGGEPLVIDDDEALARLGGIADVQLVHDRRILVRCDDSVVRLQAGQLAFVRRARGYTPRPIALPTDGPPVLALGGWFKNTFCLVRGREAFLSQHIGDLDNAATCHALERSVVHLLEVLRIQPEVVACDLHPDFFSTEHANRLAQAWGVPVRAVQHHHAHVAAVCAEHGVEGPVLGLALDGVGLGTDGTAWGGELLTVDGAAFTRLSHLSPLPLPGGDRAAREPWRLAVAVLGALGRSGQAPGRFPGRPVEAIVDMLARGVSCPTTSSAGRWFDAAAGLLGVQPVMTFEGQAAMLLEGLAARHGAVPPAPGRFALADDGTLDLLPVFARLADLDDPLLGAALFHATFAAGLSRWVRQAADRTGLRTVALGGGCWLNHILSTAVRESLQAAGLRVLEARQVPPNDGGLSLGQAVVARYAAMTGGRSCA